MTRWALATYPGLERISLYTLPENDASQAVAMRAGFAREGTLRAWDLAGDVPADVVMFSLLRRDVADHGG